MTTERIARFKICGGTLTGWCRSEVLDVYDLEPSVSTEIWLELERDGHTTEIRFAQDLFRVLLAQGCGLSLEIPPVAGSMAELTAYILGDDRALVDPKLYFFLEEPHSISLREHPPRVEGQRFRFLLGDFPNGTRQARLFDFEVDLRTGAITKRPRP